MQLLNSHWRHVRNNMYRRILSLFFWIGCAAFLSDDFFLRHLASVCSLAENTKFSFVFSNTQAEQMVFCFWAAQPFHTGTRCILTVQLEYCYEVTQLNGCFVVFKNRIIKEDFPALSVVTTHNFIAVLFSKQHAPLQIFCMRECFVLLRHCA